MLDSGLLEYQIRQSLMGDFIRSSLDFRSSSDGMLDIMSETLKASEGFLSFEGDIFRHFYES